MKQDLSDIKAVVKRRMGRNFMKMDKALWERDAAEGGPEYANARGSEVYAQIQEVRQTARNPLKTGEIAHVSAGGWMFTDSFGQEEARIHVGKSENGFHSAVEESQRGGDQVGELCWSREAFASRKDAEAHGLEALRGREDWGMVRHQGAKERPGLSESEVVEASGAVFER